MRNNQHSFLYCQSKRSVDVGNVLVQRFYPADDVIVNQARAASEPERHQVGVELLRAQGESLSHTEQGIVFVSCIK